jgi:hypothetical protein
MNCMGIFLTRTPVLFQLFTFIHNFTVPHLRQIKVFMFHFCPNTEPVMHALHKVFQMKFFIQQKTFTQTHTDLLEWDVTIGCLKL